MEPNYVPPLAPPDPAAIGGSDPTSPPSTIPAPASQDTPETAPTADVPASTAAADVKAGQLVSHTYFDPYIGAGGEEVTRVAIVLAVADGKALVSFLPVSGPLPVDELEAGPELV
jgi:hypothetical protein